MDVNHLRIAVTLISLLLFLALVLHTWSRRRSADHAAAANLPFAEEPALAEAGIDHTTNAAAGGNGAAR